jgi:endogenous inhibitor of DNA gyrase (YacG/DUF329 family)
MENHDVREQPFNEGKTGSFAETQLPRERIVRLHGIVVDLDPGLYRPGNLIFTPDDDPRTFYEKIKPVLARHPLARSAEVRLTGTGLHLIIRLDPPAELESAADQRHWHSVVGTVQHTLPGDPNAPGLTALTRAVGSVNCKNGAVVELLRPGEPVTPRAVEEFAARVAQAQFKEIALVLLGGLRAQPCPVCKSEGSRLDVRDHAGMCYGRCGKVTLARLLDCVYAPMGAPKEDAADQPTHEPVRRAAKAARPRSARAKARQAARASGRNKPNTTASKTTKPQPSASTKANGARSGARKARGGDKKGAGPSKGKAGGTKKRSAAKHNTR